MGTRGGPKIRYAQLLVDAPDLAHVPQPLDRLDALQAGAPERLVVDQHDANHRRSGAG